ncbi:unnamed protein product [Chondrus crispus]|uniref:Uncharacterized protein n=1 Tax=Chondrus crispus TaxID=2769 RepID=R7QLT9_CHOCR|nr:unnamed protein product [Chondrus crispus]CDF39467.1 unnamed protein product [Chondrus crispus]|eukprot:XP_005719378.1 unnamed protein product [Chondrus crispus]
MVAKQSIVLWTQRRTQPDCLSVSTSYWIPGIHAWKLQVALPFIRLPSEFTGQRTHCHFSTNPNRLLAAPAPCPSVFNVGTGS